jgi:hypothetical protein
MPTYPQPMANIIGALCETVEIATQMSTLSHKLNNSKCISSSDHHNIKADFIISCTCGVLCPKIKISVQLSNAYGGICKFTTKAINIEQGEEYRMVSVPCMPENTKFNIEGAKYQVSLLQANGTTTAFQGEEETTDTGGVYSVEIFHHDDFGSTKKSTLLFPIHITSPENIHGLDIASNSKINWDCISGTDPRQILSHLTQLESKFTDLQTHLCILNRLNHGSVFQIMQGNKYYKTISMSMLDEQIEQIGSLSTLMQQNANFFSINKCHSYIQAFDAGDIFDFSKTSIGVMVPNDIKTCKEYSDTMVQNLQQIKKGLDTLASFALPKASTILQFYMKRRFGDNHADQVEAQRQFQLKLEKLLSIRNKQITLIKASACNTGIKHSNNKGVQVWSGGAYGDIVNVRAHYIGLSAIDECIERHCSDLLKQNSDSAAIYRQLLPTSVHQWQLRQLKSRNTENDICLSDEAYCHNTHVINEILSLTSHGDDVQLGFMQPGTQLRLDSIVHAVLQDSDSDYQSHDKIPQFSSVGLFLASGLCVNKIHSNKTADRLNISGWDVPVLKLDTNGKDAERNIAISQLYALVNSDYLHRIIPPILHRKVCTYINATATQYVMTTSIPHASKLKDTEHQHNMPARILDLFDTNMKPLVRLALLNEKAHPSLNRGLAFITSDANSTGYNSDRCFEALVDAIFTEA